MKRLVGSNGKTFNAKSVNKMFTTAHTVIVRFADKSHHPAELSPEEKEHALEHGSFITEWKKLRSSQ